MTLRIEYITDKNGHQKSVVIPHSQWLLYQAEQTKLKNKLDILLGIRDAMKEVHRIQSGKKKGKSLRSFLNEL